MAWRRQFATSSSVGMQISAPQRESAPFASGCSCTGSSSVAPPASSSAAGATAGADSRGCVGLCATRLATETDAAHRNGARRKGKAAVASCCSERSRACRRRRRLFELPLKSISCSAATCAADETPRSTLKRAPSAPSPAACSASLLHGGTPNVSAVVASTLPLPRGCHQQLLLRDSFCRATDPVLRTWTPSCSAATCDRRCLGGSLASICWAVSAASCANNR